MSATYRINEAESRVRFFRPDSQDDGCISFRLFRSVHLGEAHFDGIDERRRVALSKSHRDKEYQSAFLVALDELLERGLIEDQSEAAVFGGRRTG